MVQACLEANDAYWRRFNAEPTKLGKWRNGTSSEAARVSLEAALAAPSHPTAPQAMDRDLVASMLESYIHLIKETGKYSEMHYIPEVEQVIGDLRAAPQSDACREPLTEHQQRWLEVGEAWDRDSSLEKWFPLTAADLAELREDAARLDWLSTQFVTVRTPLRYGSRENFMGSPEDNDGESVPWDIRAKIDAARAALGQQEKINDH
jgi:hypothetical protein